MNNLDLKISRQRFHTDPKLSFKKFHYISLKHSFINGLLLNFIKQL